jgi:hypothetical protein
VAIHDLEKLISFSGFDPLYLHQEGNRDAVGRNSRAPDAV